MSDHCEPWEVPRPAGQPQPTREDYERKMAALKEPNPNRRPVPSPREYLKIKYSAPSGGCKCGNCQLVPPEMLEAWATQLDIAVAALHQIKWLEASVSVG